MTDFFFKQKMVKFFILLSTCFIFFFLISGCTSMIKDDLPENARKGYVRFEFTKAKTTGEAALDLAVNVGIAAMGGAGSKRNELVVSCITKEADATVCKADPYDIDWADEYNFRWVAELPGKHTYRVTFRKDIIAPLYYDDTVYGDVTAEVKENMITPIKIYFLDFYDENGNPKKAQNAVAESGDTPNLDMGTEQIMGDERFHIGDPFPLADEQNSLFTKRNNNSAGVRP